MTLIYYMPQITRLVCLFSAFQLNSNCKQWRNIFISMQNNKTLDHLSWIHTPSISLHHSDFHRCKTSMITSLCFLCFLTIPTKHPSLLFLIHSPSSIHLSSPMTSLSSLSPHLNQSPTQQPLEFRKSSLKRLISCNSPITFPSKLPCFSYQT